MSEIILARLKEMLAKELNLEIEKIREDSKLADDLGADSLDTAELAMQIKDEFNYDLTDEEIVNIKTVDDLVRAISTGMVKKT